MRATSFLLLCALVGLGSACGGSVGRRAEFGFFDITYRVGKEPAKVEVPDMDCDGIRDVVTLCKGDGSVSVTRRRPVNNLGSSGQDGVEVRFRVSDSTQDFCIADVNGDGFPDVVAITGDPDFDLLTLRNDPADPGFLTLDAPSVLVPGKLTRVAGGDVNGDGLADIVVFDESAGQATLLLNSKAAPGTFLPGIPLPPFGPDCHDLLLADLDGDGLLEPMTLTSDGGFSFLRQSPRGTFVQKKWLPANFRIRERCALADMDGDGRLDVVVGAATEHLILLQDPSDPAGFRESPSKQSLGKTSTFALGDMNRDGIPDLVVREVDGSGLASVAMYLGIRESPTRFDERRHPVANLGSSGQDGVSVALCDADRDGFFDVFTELSTDGTVHALIRMAPIRESPTFARRLEIDAPPGVTWVDVAVGDLNGDGKPDFVTGGSDGLTFHFQDATSPVSFHSKTMSFGAAIDRVVVGDVDGDGRPDVAFSSHSSNVVGVVFHDAAAAEAFDPPAGSIFPTPSPMDIAIGDLDRDGRCDIATTFEGAAGGAVRCDFQSPVIPRAFTGFVDFPTGASSARALSIGDDDCDDGNDIACGNGDGTLSVLLHAPGFPPPGPGLFLPPDVLSFSGGVRVTKGDVNGDGRADLVTSDPAGVTLTLQRTDGPRGVFVPSYKIELKDALITAISVASPLVDVDQDGMPDILLEADTDGDGFTLLLNDPTATDGFTMIRESPTLPSRKGVRVATGDVNGDGWADVVTLSDPPPGGVGSSLSLWVQLPGPALGVALDPVKATTGSRGG